jgi:glycerol uptake facilitator protein
MLQRKTVAALVAEFLGTYILASVVLSMAGRTHFPYYAAVGAGVTLMVLILGIGTASQSHFNPAVTLGMWTVRKIPTSDMIAYLAVQMLAGFTAFRINEYFLDQLLPNIAKDAWDWQAVLAETLGTMVFTLGIAAAVYQGYQGVQKAVTIGLSLTAGILMASLGSNSMLNPAVAVGMHSLSASYIVGPLLGALVGINLYALLFVGRPAKTKVRSK